MQKTIRNILSIPRVGTYLYYKRDEESPTKFIEVTDILDGKVYHNGDDGKGKCTLTGWSWWIKTEIMSIEEYEL